MSFAARCAPGSTWPGSACAQFRLIIPTGTARNTNESARQIVLEFTVDETRALFHETPAVPHKVDFLLTALAQMAAAWTGSDTVLLDMMGHGRDEDAFDDVDLFGTVGFFISYTPMVLTLSGRRSGSAPELLTDQIQPIMRRGLDFDLLRYMTSDATVRQRVRCLAAGRRSCSTTWASAMSSTRCRVAPGSRWLPNRSGNTHSPSGVRYYPLAISSQVWKDQLRLNFVYSENLHARSTVESLAEQYRSRLMACVALSARK